ncbi:MAG: crotonase/enoyl-CoA hydratase family protein [Pseudomonadota bacterium]
MLVTTEIEGGIATVTLNRPDKKNAMSLELLEAVAEACASVKAAESVRAVILTGAGGVFSAGIDLTLMMSFAQQLDKIKGQMAETDATGANMFQAPITCWAGLDVPVIAALDGICFGAGMQLALGADFRVAAPDTRMSIMEAKWGLVPDMGITQSLPKLMPADRAKMLIMTGREFTGAEALEMGLVTELAEDPLGRARELAQLLAQKSPDALAASKKLVEDCWGSGGADALKLEADLQAALMGAPNQMEAVMANMQKRPPKFGNAH